MRLSQTAEAKEAKVALIPRIRKDKDEGRQATKAVNAIQVSKTLARAGVTQTTKRRYLSWRWAGTKKIEPSLAQAPALCLKYVLKSPYHMRGSPSAHSAFRSTRWRL